jgi:hypothetical protein
MKGVLQRSVAGCLAALALALVSPSPARAQQASAAQLRHVSFAVQDAPASAEEARRFVAGEVTLAQLVDEWMKGDGHRAKIRRFFYDMFGTQDFGAFSTDAVLLHKNAAGILGLPDKPNCTPGEASDVYAWWLEPGQTVKVCSNVLSDVIWVGEPFTADRKSCLDAKGMEDSRCGCGPDLIICAPKSKQLETGRSLYTEFVDRGLYMYEGGRSWSDLLSANLFYGTRYEYYVYLWRGWIYPYNMVPSPGDLQRLKSLPTDRKGVTEFPEMGGERAPVVTGINFMHQYNNFRSRVRILSERLLCQPIGPALNTDGIQTFVNPDFSDANRSHGSKPGCSICHHALDNLGSTLLRWNDQGVYDWKDQSQLGRAFGQTGEGPRFLMRGFVERGPGFGECMARRAWETFSGMPWDTLPAPDRQALQQLTSAGPRALIRGVIASPSLQNLR